MAEGMGAASLAQRLAVAGSLPRLRTRAAAPLRIGFLVPLSGAQEGWGRPGLDGCRIWADGINAHGGLMVAGRRHRVEFTVADSAGDPGQVAAAARAMAERDRVPLVLTLGGDEAAPAFEALMAARVLVSTLLPTDLSPDRPYLIAPAEVHPLFNVTGIDWLVRERPAARRIALASQDDLMGLPSLAVYRAACEAAGLQIVAEERYAPETGTGEAAGMVARMIAAGADVLCWCSSAPPMVKALTVAAHAQGFAGEMLSCTGDQYGEMIARTSPGFMERFTFQFPDFDDPALGGMAAFFRRPKEFFDSYNTRFPGAWSAVSWEYAAILDLWHDAVQLAETTGPVSVLAAMKRGREMTQAFGAARWWGEGIFGIDNALVGRWPVVRIVGGRARIAEFGSVIDWLDRNEALLSRHLAGLGQLWHQRRQPHSTVSGDVVP